MNAIPCLTIQDVANLVRHLFLFFAGHWFQIHVKLAAMRPPRVFAEFGAARLLLHRRDFCVVQQFV